MFPETSAPLQKHQHHYRNISTITETSAPLEIFYSLAQGADPSRPSLLSTIRTIS